MSKEEWTKEQKDIIGSYDAAVKISNYVKENCNEFSGSQKTEALIILLSTIIITMSDESPDGSIESCKDTMKGFIDDFTDLQLNIKGKDLKEVTEKCDKKSTFSDFLRGKLF